MPARVANIVKLVHYALLIKQLRFDLTFFKVLANFPTDKYGLDCGLELNAKVFQLRPNNVSGVLVLEGCDYFPPIFPKPAMAAGQQLSSR